MRKVLAGVVAVAALGTASIALADTPGGTTDACYNDRTGIVRVDIRGTGCRLGESPIRLGSGLVTRKVSAVGHVGPISDIPPTAADTAYAYCNPGEVVLGGGYGLASINPDVAVWTNAPFDIEGKVGWMVSVVNDTEGEFDFWAFAICGVGTTAAGS
jgi:hypothetical protein